MTMLYSRFWQRFLSKIVWKWRKKIGSKHWYWTKTTGLQIKIIVFIDEKSLYQITNQISVQFEQRWQK